MDFPYEFSQGCTFVRSLEEVKQNIYEVLVNYIRTFRQSDKLGSSVSLHTSDAGLIEFSMRNTLAVLNNVTLDHCEVEQKDTVCNIRLYVKYGDVDLVISHSYAN